MKNPKENDLREMATERPLSGDFNKDALFFLRENDPSFSEAKALSPADLAEKLARLLSKGDLGNERVARAVSVLKECPDVAFIEDQTERNKRWEKFIEGLTPIIQGISEEGIGLLSRIKEIPVRQNWVEKTSMEIGNTHKEVIYFLKMVRGILVRHGVDTSVICFDKILHLVNLATMARLDAKKEVAELEAGYKDVEKGDGRKGPIVN